MAAFSFLTNHGLAVLCIAHDPRSRIRDIAGALGITERAAQRIVGELVESGYLTRAREGRRNVYVVRSELRIALPTQRDIDLGALLGVLVPAGTSAERRERIDETDSGPVSALAIPG